MNEISNAKGLQFLKAQLIFVIYAVRNFGRCFFIRLSYNNKCSGNNFENSSRIELN